MGRTLRSEKRCTACLLSAGTTYSHLFSTLHNLLHLLYCGRRQGPMELQGLITSLRLLKTVVKPIPAVGPVLEAAVDVLQQSCEIVQVGKYTHTSDFKLY
jgi:hypothetical protein